MHRSRALPLAALALAAAACGGAPSSPAARTAAASGETNYRSRTCWRCHGADRSGTEIGPPLHDLARSWDAESLERYIDDPAPFRARDPRLQGLVTRYRGRLMKGFPMDPAERRALAAWLLRE
jgi:cytochrome c2